MKNRELFKNAIAYAFITTIRNYVDLLRVSLQGIISLVYAGIIGAVCFTAASIFFSVPDWPIVLIIFYTIVSGFFVSHYTICFT
jgi:hypothetical protein